MSVCLAVWVPSGIHKPVYLPTVYLIMQLGVVLVYFSSYLFTCIYVLTMSQMRLHQCSLSLILHVMSSVCLPVCLSVVCLSV